MTPLPESSARRMERLSAWDGAAFSLMVGLGETFIPAFVLALGLGESASGLITTLPILVGSGLQLSSSWFVQRLGSFRRWVVLCAILQALSFIPLIHVARHNIAEFWIPFLCTCLYWASGMGAGLIWNAWMANLVPESHRVKFWGQRTWLSFTGALVGFIGGGVILQSFGSPLQAFLLIFALSFAFRTVSALFLSLHPEPLGAARVPSTNFDGIRYILRGQNAEYVRFMLFMNFAVYVAAPFFSAFMLMELKQTYLEYVVLIATAMATKVLGMPILTRWVHRHGTQKLMWLSGIGIAALPALWLFSGNFWYLFVLQALSGLIWGAQELSFPIFLLDHTPARDRISVLAVYNLGRSVSIAVASLVGAFLLHEWGTHWMAYAKIFVVSTVLRGLSLFAIRRPKILRPRLRLFWRTTGLRPSMGAITPPIVSETEEDSDPRDSAARASRRLRR